MAKQASEERDKECSLGPAQNVGTAANGGATISR